MTWQSKSAAIAIAIMAMSLHSNSVQAMPEQGKVVAGQGEIARPDEKTMVINQKTDRLALDWQKFNIAKDEKVHFDQNSKSAIALNRVVGDGRSIIDGSLSAKGHVFVINPNGVLFGKNSSVDVGGLVASTANVTDDDMRNFAQGKGDLGLQIAAGREASVINAGTIKAEGGLVALHATTVENTGTIANEGGQTVLAAAKNLNLAADTAGKLNFTVNGSLANAKALNSGTLRNDGGYLVMTAKSAGDLMSTVVNNTGVIEAKTLHANDKGEILLDGGESGQVEVSGTLDASGTEAGQSAGSIKVIGQKTVVNDGTNLLARGAIDGGKIETSGDVLNLGDNLNIDASGDKGSHGTWLLDPLEVVISASKPSGADHDYGTIVGDTNGITKNNVIYNDPPSGQNANNSYNSTTWIDSTQVGTILSNGTDVMIQAISSSGAASITLESPIDITVSKSASKNPTFTLEANRNITINQNITAESSGKGLNVMLNADTDGDNIGAVIMNADVTTNGGWFKSATGGNVTHTYGTSDADKQNYGTYNGVKVGGGPNHDGSTVGTYFGGKDTAKQADNRFIKTNGGAITLNGEVAIGLNGGTLTLDTAGGDLTVTGLINSGNSYKAYIYGTDDWNNNDMIKKMVKQYLEDGTVPAYHYIGITYERDSKGNLIEDGKGGYKWSYDAKNYTNGGKPENIHYVLKALTDTSGSAGGEDFSTINPRWYTTTAAGSGYDSFIVDKASTITVDEYLAYVKKSAPGNFKSKYNADTYDAIKKDDTKMVTLESDIAELIAHNWFLAEQIAENGTSGGANVGDSYLATITTRLENSLSTPNGQHTLWVGGRGSGVRGRTVNDDKNNPATWGPSDPTLMDGFYWVTGPEGAASTYKDSEGNTLKYDAGIKFWDTVSSDWKTGKNGEKAYGLDPTWSTYTAGRTITQPDNNGPFLTVGYGSDNQWDDANFGGETTWGFVQENNLANSSLKINTGKGTVALKGDIGKGQALDTLSIDGGTVKIGDTSNKVTDYNHGTVYVDHGLKITGTGNVTVGGEIHSGENPETDTSTTLKDTYKDNVTILSSGDIEVHGIMSNTYDDGTTTTRGGKISLTSTGKTGKITLGAGVDYNGKDTEGTLAAASADKGAVVIDAQGSQGSLVNNTKGTDAITTGGTWQVYVNSPSDYDTNLGSNLKSGTNAQWTARSDNNATVTTNSSGNTLTDYNDTSSNKFIFQVTPVITISGGYTSKTYGDNLAEEKMVETLTSKAAYKDSKGSDIDVTNFKNNFDESQYLNYVTISDGTNTKIGLSTVNVSSEGAAQTATRTNGNEKAEGSDAYKTADDKNRAFYVMDVAYQDGVKTLNGYDKAANPGEVEITRKTLTINNSGTQTYGNADVTSGTPEDYSSQLVNKDKLDAADITYTIATDGTGTYAASKGSNTTAHAGNYENQYLTTSAKVKASDGSDASANYAVTGSGTITVNPADLYLTVGNVSTAYGTAFDDTKYGYTVDSTKGGLVNGDTQSVLGDKFLNYTNTGAKTDASNDKVKTQNAGSYELQGAASKELSDYTVHITNGKSTVNKATLTVNPEDIHRIYGQAAEVQEDAKTAYNLSGFANGDTKDTVDATNKDGKTIDQLVKVTNDVSKALKDENTHTQNASTVGYGMVTKATGDLTNYNIVIGDPKKVYLDKAELVIDTDSNSKVYGDWQGVKNDVEGAAHIRDAETAVVNGDKVSDLEKEMGLTTSSEALIKNADGTYKTNHVKDGGYAIDTKFADAITNYTVKRGAAGTETLTKAQATVDTDNVTTTYGTADKNYTSHFNTAVNGDNGDELLKQLNLSYSTDAYDKDGKPTNDVKEGGYDLIVAAKGSLTHDDYDITLKNANVTLNKAKLVIDTDSNSKVYGDWQGVKNDVEGAAHIRNAETSVVNGDKVADLVAEMGLKTSSDALQQNADGTYKTNHVKDGGYTIETEFSDTIKNYDVSQGTVGIETLTKAKAEVDTDNVITTYGTVDKNYTSHFNTAVNGDNGDELLKQLKLSYSTDAYDKDGNPTNDVKEGGYDLLVTANGSLDHDDYDVTVKNANVTLNKAKLVIDTDSNSKVYGDWQGVKNDVEGAAHIRNAETAVVNGDKVDDLIKEMNLKTSSDALQQNTDGTYKTNHVKDGGYAITTEFSDTIKNYDVSQGTVGTETLTKAKATVDTDAVTTTYGTVNKNYTSHFNTAVNGDDPAKLLEDLKLTYTTEAYKDDTHTNDVKDGGYTLDVEKTADLGDYDVTVNGSNVILNPKAITIRNTMTQQYGSPEKTFSEATVPADQLANGDRISTKDLKFGIVSGGKYDTSLKENQAKHEGVVSADAGTYWGELTHTGGGITHEDGTDAYKNYKVTVEGDIIVTPADLTVKINDASTQYGTPFDEESGKKSYDYTVVSGNANGETKAEVKDLLGQLKNYKNAGVGDNGRATKDVGSYDITGEQDNKLTNYTVKIEDGTATITKAPLEITTKDVSVDYGTAYGTTVGKTVSLVDGLTNGDAEKASDLSYNYGNYGGGYIENNKKTNHVGGYDFKTTVSNKSEDFLKNYTISGGDARLTINPKDVYFHVDGNGNTLGDVVYTVTDPNNPSSPDPINGQLVYGETVTPSYMPDGRLPNGHYGVSTSLPGYGPIDSGKVYGNYRYHYDGDITVNLPSKPDIVPPVNPPVTPGTGTVTPLPETPENTSNTPENTTETTGHKTVWDGDRDRGGDRPEDKRVVTLPFFKVLEDKTTHRYGTYDVAKRTTEVKIAPSAQVLPEPNQPATQYRELDTELTTDKGTGEFTLKYNGSRFTILPDDDAAAQLIVAGDETKNRDLFEKALHVAFTKMGLEVADLDGVYIHFGKE